MANTQECYRERLSRRGKRFVDLRRPAWVRMFKRFVIDLRTLHPLFNTFWPTKESTLLISRGQRAVLLYVQIMYACAIVALFFGNEPESSQLVAVAVYNSVLLLPVKTVSLLGACLRVAVRSTKLKLAI